MGSIPGSGRSTGKGIGYPLQYSWGFPCGSAGKEFTCNAGDLGSISGLGRSPGGGKGYSLQYSALENSMDYIVHGVSKSRTWLSDFHFTRSISFTSRASQVALVLKNLHANAGDARDVGLISGLGRYPEKENGNPLQYFCPQTSINRETWRATVHGVAESRYDWACTNYFVSRWEEHGNNCHDCHICRFLDYTPNKAKQNLQTLGPSSALETNFHKKSSSS